MIFNVLIVDDVARNIQVVASILQKEGYRMAFAQDGKAALEQVKRTDFDLILLDIMMPEMDGISVCQELKTNPDTRDIPVIFLTAKTEPEDIVKGFETGAVDYVTKPFNSSELLARVKTHLELKAARETLKQNNKELKELNAQKDKFFSIIAHDLRNPIQTLLLSTELLNSSYDSYDDEKKKTYIRRFHKSANHISTLLENLMHWSRAQRGMITPVPNQLDLYTIAAGTLTLLSQQAAGKEITLESSVPRGTPAFADQDMVQAVFRNLISNAIKFTPHGGKVEISAQEAGANIRFNITDTGVGMPPETVEKLFRIDGHISAKGTDGEKGTGLGLILCKEFVEQNNGTINVDSSEGKGTCFTVLLPKYNNAVE